MKKDIKTDTAPAAIGPYSQGVVLGNLVFTSGQLPIDPRTSQIESEDIKAQTRQSLENVKAVLESGGASLATVVKTTCFLADLSDFAAFNEVYTDYFGLNGVPARSCVEAARLPRDARVEIEAVAYVEAPGCESKRMMRE